MKLKGILLVMITCSLSSCQWGTPTKDKPAITTDTLQFVYQNIKQKKAGSQADISYPVFKNQPTLNDSLSSYFTNQNNTTSSRHINVLVLRQDSSLTMIEINEVYQGGKSGQKTVTHFINWNTKKIKLIKLSDILIDQYSDELNKIAEAIFRKNENLSATASLNGYSFKSGQFALTDNFLITPIGLYFLFNSGEAKPDSYGQIVVFVPYEQIITLLRPNTVIEQYHK